MKAKDFDERFGRGETCFDTSTWREPHAPETSSGVSTWTSRMDDRFARQGSKRLGVTKAVNHQGLDRRTPAEGMKVEQGLHPTGADAFVGAGG